MNFELSEEEKLLEELARKLGQELRTRHREMEKKGLDEELVKKYREAELLRLDWEETYGGQALPATAKVIVLENLAFGCAAATLGLDRDTLLTLPLRLAGAEPESVNALCGKDGWLILDCSFPIKRDEGRVTIRCPYLPCRKPERLVVVEAQSCSILKDLPVKENVWPGALHALGGIAVEAQASPEKFYDFPKEKKAKLLAYLRLYIASLLCGVSFASLDYTLNYTQQREAFGKKVAHHQGVAFLLADMKMQADGVRVMNYQAAWAFQRGELLMAHLAFAQACEASLFVTNYGVQLLGGHGYIEDHPVEKWMREARALSLFFGGKDAAELDAKEVVFEL